MHSVYTDSQGITLTHSAEVKPYLSHIGHKPTHTELKIKNTLTVQDQLFLWFCYPHQSKLIWGGALSWGKEGGGRQKKKGQKERGEGREREREREIGRVHQ